MINYASNSLVKAVLVIALMSVMVFTFANVAYADDYVDLGGYDGGYDYYDLGGYDGGYDYYDLGGYDYEDYDYFEYDYNDYDYDYGCDWDCYSYDDYDYDYGCYDCYSYSTPTYTTPGCSFCGGSTPRYTAPSSSSYYSNYNSNTVTNTNVNNITNIDNSIRDSFNTYDSYNTSIVVATPQTPVVYTSPAPYCTINHALSGSYGYNGSVAYLSWTSTNASSAHLSNVGSVGVSGSQNVYPNYTTTYTLTVYGQNGQTAACATTVNVNTYVPPTYIPPAPYISLTQIPYTGFDFGPLGNALYWASLLGFAAAGAYLMLYFRGGVFAFATNMVPARKFAPVVAPKAPLLVEKEAAEKMAPVVAALRKSGTLDTMAIVQSKDGSMPKIVIQRN